MFIFRALVKHGPFHAAKVATITEKCNNLGGIFLDIIEVEEKR